MASATPDLRLPSRLQSVAALWPVPIKLYCLVTEAHGCEQLAQSCYSVADRPGVELATFRSRANALPTEPPSVCDVGLYGIRNESEMLALHFFASRYIVGL